MKITSIKKHSYGKFYPESAYANLDNKPARLYVNTPWSLIYACGADA